jgi:hypothetical protein
MAGKLAEIYNPSVPFIVGGSFVIISVLFILINKKHINHVDDVELGH